MLCKITEHPSEALIEIQNKGIMISFIS